MYLLRKCLFTTEIPDKGNAELRANPYLPSYSFAPRPVAQPQPAELCGFAGLRQTGQHTPGSSDRDRTPWTDQPTLNSQVQSSHEARWQHQVLNRRRLHKLIIQHCSSLYTELVSYRSWQEWEQLIWWYLLDLIYFYDTDKYLENLLFLLVTNNSDILALAFSFFSIPQEFSSVADIIDHFQRTPLLLIDGKDRGSRNQCMLKYAAGRI